ncbi:kelch-like protein 30 [Trichonephila clavata]|uniref:Kelch-like protein diablo n=1 Tax=Trichonephila clavata TaxID=2740835 RepID=A0A8X6M5G0_TRICU|nr:kelch-like protein 30 [Trichonephila clavata]
MRFADIFASDSYKFLETFADATLRTEDGTKFKVHRIILAYRSIYFKTLFCSDFGDGSDILLKGMDSKTLENVLIYLYTGNIQLDSENAADVLIASDYFMIDPLMKESRSFVLKDMTLSNCIYLFLTTWRIEKLGILDYCHRFIIVNFEKVVTGSDEIGALPLEAVTRCFKEKCLNISSERTVWNAIVKWVIYDYPERLKFVPELLKYISVEDANEMLLKEIISHYVVQENPFCSDLILSTSQAHSGNMQNFQNILKSESFVRESRVPTNLHLITHYYNGFSVNVYFTCDGEIDFWRKIANIAICPDYLVQLGHHIYMFDSWTNRSLIFDLLESKCIPMVPISKNRCRYCVVSVNGCIYVIGGSVEVLEDVMDIERYDPTKGKWEQVSSMVPMFLCEVVAMNGHIYAIGNISNPIMMVQVYDPFSDAWSFVSAPRNFRYDFTTIAFHGHLYIIGGETIDCVLRSTEVYDPVKDVWMPMPDLPFSYVIPKAIVLKDVLIVYEENLINRDRTPPVYWDPENRVWRVIQESSPLRKIHLFKSCTITDPKVVKDIVQQNRRQDNEWIKSLLA